MRRILTALVLSVLLGINPGYAQSTTTDTLPNWISNIFATIASEISRAQTSENNNAAAAAAAQLTANSAVPKGRDVVNIVDYCTLSCSTVAQQTAAYLAAVAYINSKGGGTVYFPQGNWNFDASVAGPGVFTTYGASIKGSGVGSTTITVFNGSFATWTPPLNQPNGGHGSISDLRLYESDNPGSGAQILFDRVNGMEISNLWIGGGHISLDLASAVGVHGSNVTIEGDNTSSGAVGLRIHRASSGSSHNSENNFTNLNIRGANGKTIQNAILLNDSDGLFINNGHIGFSSAEAFLIQPEYASDYVDNVHSIGVDYDTANYGVRFAPYVGTFTGYIGQNTFSGGLVEIMNHDGFRVDDPAVRDLTLSGFSTTLNGSVGINIQAGSNISITGGTFRCDNTNNDGSPHILIGGTSANVSVTGVGYRGGCVNGVPYNLLISNTADYVNVGPASYLGAATGDISKTTNGTHISIAQGVTDKATVPWFNTAPDVLGGFIKSQAGSTVAQYLTSAPNSSNVDYGVFQANGAGGGFSIYGGGASGINTSLTVGSLGGVTNIGGGSLNSLKTTGGEQVRIKNAASAVNYVALMGASTGVSPNLSVDGTDTNINLNISGKGTGIVSVTGGLQVSGFVNLIGGGFLGGGSSNYLNWNGAGIGQSPSISAAGTDTNIALALIGKGNSGVLSSSFIRTVDPVSSDISSGQCADWNNTTAGTYKHVCNFGGTLRSVSMN